MGRAYSGCNSMVISGRKVLIRFVSTCLTYAAKFSLCAVRAVGSSMGMNPWTMWLNVVSLRPRCAQGCSNGTD